MSPITHAGYNNKLQMKTFSCSLNKFSSLQIPPRRQSSLANNKNHHSSTSPRTGSSDHLDNEGSTHNKSPETLGGDFEDSGFMGSESSRQSNQKKHYGYKRLGLDHAKIK